MKKVRIWMLSVVIWIYGSYLRVMRPRWERLPRNISRPITPAAPDSIDPALNRKSKQIQAA